jgi:hypothetical protein
MAGSLLALHDIAVTAALAGKAGVMERPGRIRASLGAAQARARLQDANYQCFRPLAE